MTPCEDSRICPSGNRWRWRVFALTWIAYAGFYLCRKNFAVAMPLLAAEFGYSSTDFAGVLFCDGLTYCIAQIAFGALADRAGPRRTAALGLAITVAAASLMSNAASLAAFAFLAAMNGFGQGAGWPALVKHVGARFPRRSRGVVMAWWSTNYMVGGFAATAFTAWIATHPTLFAALDWRRAFLIPASLTALAGAAYLLFSRGPSSGAPPVEAVQPPVIRGSHPSAFLRDRDVWALSLGSLFSKVVRYSFMFWLPLYLVQRFHCSARDAGVLSSAFELAGPAGALLAGFLSDRVMRARRRPAAALLFAGLALACWLHSALAATGPAGLLSSIASLGVFNHGPDALLQGAAAQDLGQRWGAGLAAGFVSGLSSLGQLLAPVLVAGVAAGYGWDGVFPVLSLFALAGGAAMLWRRRESTL